MFLLHMKLSVFLHQNLSVKLKRSSFSAHSSAKQAIAQLCAKKILDYFRDYIAQGI